MNRRIERWLDALDEAEAAERRATKAEAAARKAPLPKRLKPAIPSDIKVGAIIWYKHGDDGHFWAMVSEPRHYGDPFKAYVAHDGCRYGLDDAWVEY